MGLLRFFNVLKEGSYAHQGCIHLIKNTFKALLIHHHEYYYKLKQPFSVLIHFVKARLNIQQQLLQSSVSHE